MTLGLPNLECGLLDRELAEALSDVEEDPADVVLGEVDVAAVERRQAVDQVDVQLHRVEVVQQLKQNPGLNKTS